MQQKREKRVDKTGSQKTVQQLLGELYADKVYLEKLLDDDSNFFLINEILDNIIDYLIVFIVATKQNTKTGDAIYGLANGGLDFLDSRTEFWRQQKPIYARKRKEFVKSPSSSKDPLNYILQQFEIIDNCKCFLYYTLIAL